MTKKYDEWKKEEKKLNPTGCRHEEDGFELVEKDYGMYCSNLKCNALMCKCGCEKCYNEHWSKFE